MGRPGRGRRRARGDGPRRGPLLRRPDRRAARRRDHRHQRQDDDRLPGPPHPRARRGPDRPAGDGEAGRRRGRGGGRAHDSRRRSTCRRPSAAWSTPATAPARWRSPRTRSALRRTDGIRFAVAAFTNLTQDHLDFHADMEDYFLAKRRLFAAGRAERAVVNLDDPYGDRLAAEFEALTFSARGDERADLPGARAVASTPPARAFAASAPDGEAEVALPLPGPVQRRERALRDRLRGGARRRARRRGRRRWRAPTACPGRFEPVDEGQPFAVLVDYAHTPDSLENVLAAARQITDGTADLRLRLRRRSRPRQAAADGRDRRPARRPGRRHLRQPALRGPAGDRRRDPRRDGRGARRRSRSSPIAGRRSRSRSRRRARGDTVVIAGKGHEQGQEFEGGRKIPFDDRDVAREELRRLAAPARAGQ